MNKKLELKRDGWASELARIQEALNNRYVVPLKSTPFDLFFARNPDMRKKSRGEAEGDEKRVDVESNAGKLRKRNEVVVEEVYLKIAEGAKRVRQEGCDRKSKKRRRAKKFGVGELVMVRVDRKLKQDPFYEGVFEVVKFVKEKAEYQLARMGEREVRVRTRHENLKRASGSEVKGEGRYEVTRVEDMREEQGVRKYLVKWKGHRERTWEKEGNLVGAEVVYDMGATHSHCDKAWARKYGVRWKSRREYAVTQSGLEVLVKGEAWVKFKYGQLTYKQKWLVIQGSWEFAAINERDGVKLGIYVTGIAPVHVGANSSVVDDREWLEEGEFSGGTEELLESKKLEVVEGIIGEAMAANAELPDRSVCHDASLVHSFDVPKGTVIY